MSQSPSLANGPTAGKRRRARLVLWAAGVVALLGLVGGGIASSHLTSSLSDYDAPSSAVVLAQHQIQRVTGSNPEEGYVVVVRTAAPITTSSAVPARVASVVSSSGPDPRSRASLTTPTPADPSMISSNGTLTAVVATVGAVNEQKAVTALQKSIAAQPSLKGNTWLGGPTVAGVQIASVSSQDLGRAELFALPFLLLLLFFVFRGLRAAAVPLVGAVFAIAVTLGVMGLALVVVPLSIFALNLVIALGIGLSVDFSLLIISRFRKSSDEVLRSTPPWSPSVALLVTPSCSARSLSLRRWPPWPCSPSASSTRWGSPARSSSWLLARSPCSSCRRS